MFESQPQVIIHTVVTHPPGTTFDEHGNPIPPPGTQTPGAPETAEPDASLPKTETETETEGE
jgi:hypothetical protein